MPNNHGSQHYFMLYNMAVIPDLKYMSHIYDNCFGKRSYQQSVKEVLGVTLGNKADSIKHYKKYERKWRK